MVAGEPWILALGIAAGTLLSEDVALLSSVGLASGGQLGWGLAFVAAAGGIIAGDLGLYGLGRWLGSLLPLFPWLKSRLDEGRLSRGRAWIEQAGFGGVLVSRFLPGTRLVGYTAAGLTRAAFTPFAVAVLLSGLVWVGLVLGISELALRFDGRPLTALAAALVFMAGLAVLYGGRRTWRLRWARLDRWRHAEFWPAWFFYLPVAVHYLRLSLRYRHPLLPSAADPMIPGGGLINESKSEIYKRLPKGAWSLRYRRLEAGAGSTAARRALRDLRLRLPVVAKPDQGQRGSGVRLIHSLKDLDAYASNARSPWLLQEYCALPNEAGVFYVRPPGQKHGFIYSFTDKRFPEVLGDGRRALAELILDHPRLRLQADIFFARHSDGLDRVLAPGERLRLSQAGNHCQGTLFLDGRSLVGRGLLRTLDRIANRTPGFYIGRFDLRYALEEALRQGRGFKLIELNLGGAEATHIYDPAVPLGEAYRVLFGQWDMLFERGEHERRRGAKVMGVREFLRELRDYRRASAQHGGTD